MADLARDPRDSAGGAVRPMQPADLAACADVFYDAVDELYDRNARPRLPRNPDPLVGLFGHLLDTDPARCHVAVEADRLIAFGIGQRRGDTSFLSFLFVHPRHQSAGLGRRLTMRCMPEAREAPAERSVASRLAVCAESIQPVSLGLYASLGMTPRLPIFLLTGAPRPGRPLPDRGRLTATAFTELAASDHEALAAAVGELDRATLGYGHPQDHRFWVRSGRQGWLFRDPLDGRTVGYGYAASSGRLGPVATTEPRWLGPAVSYLLGAVSPSDGWQIHVPGSSSVLSALLRAGLRMEDAPVLWCATSDGPAFDRYLVGSYALL